MSHAVHLYISGRVQGVGFRFFTVNRASKYGISGWVRNLMDGRVEIEAEGDIESLRMFLDDVRRGPGAGHVSDVDEEWSETDSPRYRRFSVSY
jgi:acylphosphatase